MLRAADRLDSINFEFKCGPVSSAHTRQKKLTNFIFYGEAFFLVDSVEFHGQFHAKIDFIFIVQDQDHNRSSDFVGGYISI